MTTPDNRQRLLRVALRLFASRGYDATGVQDVVVEAGVTKPTLYHYFGSKAGLLDALFRETSREYLEAFEEAATYEGDLPRNLSRLMAATLAFAGRRPEFYRFQLMVGVLPPAHDARRVAAPYFERQVRALETMFREATRDHGNMAGRHQRYALTYLGHLNSCAVLVLNGMQEDGDRLRHEAMHQFSHGIYS